jgi:GMP synthase (glutamine-hydrolysing)
MSRGGPVLLFLLGEAPEPVRAEHGDYALWFERVWGGPLAVHEGRSGANAPDPRAFSGIVVSGSPASLTAPTPWMEEAAAMIRRAYEVGTPTLGVCFGHQLIAWAFGGRVMKNPLGWEIGSLDVWLGDEGARDPLFAGLPSRLRVNLTHEDMVDPAALGDGVRALAASERCAVQALAVGTHVRGVQFHPEISGAVCRSYIEARRTRLGDQDPDALLARTGDSPHAVAVMRNFRRHFVEGA